VQSAPPAPMWRVGLAVALTLAIPLLALPSAVRAVTTERVVSDRLTGFAINGVDPVAYYIDGGPVYGDAQYEYRYAGVTWRFRNQGNKAAFVASPDVYMPRYGGYDPLALGRDVVLPGNPLLWAMVGERLYLFHDDEARARFIANPAEAIAVADGKWPTLIERLIP
jgi:YHS domain-containing protein